MGTQLQVLCPQCILVSHTHTRNTHTHPCAHTELHREGEIEQCLAFFFLTTNKWLTACSLSGSVANNEVKWNFATPVLQTSWGNLTLMIWFFFSLFFGMNPKHSSVCRMDSSMVSDSALYFYLVYLKRRCNSTKWCSFTKAKQLPACRQQLLTQWALNLNWANKDITDVTVSLWMLMG